MESISEKNNYVKISYIILDIIPRFSRKLFIEKWNEKHPDKRWNSDANSGNNLYSELPEGFRRNKAKKIFIDKMVTGRESEWDTTTLAQVLVDSGLNLIKKCRRKGQRSNPLRISEQIDTLRHVRNNFFAHLPSMSYSSQEFADSLANIKRIALSLFGEEAVREIAVIETSKIEKEIYEMADELVKAELNCLKGK